MVKNFVYNNPIGIFDSGIGGLNILQAVKKQLPRESLIYFADTKNCPYGSKTKNEIITFSEAVTEFLLDKNCKLIVVACNTATGAAINHLRKKYPVPFVGIEPATKPAAEYTKTGNIGILATEHTFQTEHFNNTKNKHAKKINVHIQPGIGLVEQIEANEIESKKTKVLLKKYLNPLLEKNIDALVLGCTHYPFLESEIKKILPQNVVLFDPSKAIAEQVKKLLQENLLLNSDSDKPIYQFITSGNQNIFKQLLTQFLHFDHWMLLE